MATLAGVIEDARRRGFVGRAAELARFDAVLAGVDIRRVMYVHGPGGIGKTALLDQFRVRSRAAGRCIVDIDARDIDWSPDTLGSALDRALTGGGTGGLVLLVDGYERLAPIDGWIRSEFLPSLPADTIVVLAGQEPPNPPWRTDPGWRSLVAVHPLGALGPTESRDLLVAAGVPVEHVQRLAALGQGHPLTLALLADAVSAGHAVSDDLSDEPDLVALLVTQVVGEVPSEAHAIGLAVCAHAWVTNEDLLRRAVGNDAPEVWAWLEGRPYVTRTTSGLRPHDLVRDALDADLRSRSPDIYRRVHRIVHEHVMANLRRAGTPDHMHWAHQKMWLHRRSPLSVAYLTIRDKGPAPIVPADPSDHPLVLDLIERFEGAESAALAERWFAALPENLLVIRSGGRIKSFVYKVVHPTDPSLCDADPVVRSILDHAARTSPARPGEQIWIGRFFGGADGYQHDPYGVVIAAVSSTIDWVTQPLAWTYTPSVDPGFWGPGFGYIAFMPHLETEFGGNHYTVYGVDWRRLTVEAWLDLLDERELTGATGPAPPERLRPPALDRARFDAAVRAALRDLHQPDRLQANPLMGSALGFGYEGPDVDRLLATVHAAIAQIGREPRGDALHRVLDRTYLRAAPSQEAAAEVLDLPFSTYRRHLGRAVERLTDLLWAVEIGQVRLESEHQLSTN
jgi:hypothetical protein